MPTDEGIVFPPSSLDRQPKTKTEAIDAELSRRLRLYATRHGWDTTVSKLRWDAAFAILRRRYGDAEVERRLSGYIAHEIVRPRIRDGEEFKRHWTWIGDEIARAEARRPPAELSAEARDILADLATLQWRPDAAAQLPAAVEQSVKNLKSFHTRLREAFVPTALYSERELVLGQFAGGFVSYLARWFRDVHARYAGWAAWNGDMGRAVWTPEHESFTRAVADSLRRYGSAGSAWGDLLAVITEAK